MLQDQAARPRCQLSSRHCFNVGSGKRDDRGCTLLHVGARKGDLKKIRWHAQGQENQKESANPWEAQRITDTIKQVEASFLLLLIMAMPKT